MISNNDRRTAVAVDRIVGVLAIGPEDIPLGRYARGPLMAKMHIEL